MHSEVFDGAATETQLASLSIKTAAARAEAAGYEMWGEPGCYYGLALADRISAAAARLDAARRAMRAWEPVSPTGGDPPPLPTLAARPVAERNRDERESVRHHAGIRLSGAEAKLRKGGRRLRAAAAAGRRDEPMPHQVQLEFTAIADEAEQLADAAAAGRAALENTVPATFRAVWAERVARWRAGRAYSSWQRASRRADAASART